MAAGATPPLESISALVASAVAVAPSLSASSFSFFFLLEALGRDEVPGVATTATFRLAAAAAGRFSLVETAFPETS